MAKAELLLGVGVTSGLTIGYLVSQAAPEDPFIREGTILLGAIGGVIGVIVFLTSKSSGRRGPETIDGEHRELPPLPPGPRQLPPKRR